MAEQSGDEPFITALSAMSESTWTDMWAAYDALAGEREFATWGGGEAVDVVIDGGLFRSTGCRGTVLPVTRAGRGST